MEKANLDGVEHGHRAGYYWHPAVALVVLLNETDGFGSLPECRPSGAWCRVKAALSALDGVLAAEKEVGVEVKKAEDTLTHQIKFRQTMSLTGRPL